ncbi:hypothetical protein NODU109028_17450 [Nocardioides dubius]
MGSWYERPVGETLTLRQAPRLASWNSATHPDQIRLKEYLDDTADLLGPAMMRSGPWALSLDVGLPRGRELTAMADLDNYVYPLASRLLNERLVSVWCTKRHSRTSQVAIGPAGVAQAPANTYEVRTTASAQSAEYKEQVRRGLANVGELQAGPVWLHISFVVGPQRNWMNLWKPTIDALDPLLGRTTVDRDWHPKDGRITELALHLEVDPVMGHDVGISIAAGQDRPTLNVEPEGTS